MELSGKITFITGFEKNCGKTTFLNYLLSKSDSNRKILCATVGVDYEEKSFLDDGYKPKVLVKKNWRAVTNTAFLKSFNFSYKLNDIYDQDIAGGRPAVITPQYDSYIKLFSPGTHLFEILKSQENYADRIFIDGAFDRITQISKFSNAEFYYVFKVTPSNIDSVREKIKLLNSFMEVEVSNKNNDFINSISSDFEVLNDTVYLKGALTYSRIEKFPGDFKKVVISDFTKVFLNYTEWSSFINNYKIFFTSTFKFCGYVINLYDINMKDFEKGFDKKILSKFLYNPYEYRKIL